MGRDDIQCTGRSSYSYPDAPNVTVRKSSSTKGEHSNSSRRPTTLDDIGGILARFEAKLDVITEMQRSMADITTRLDACEKKVIDIQDTIDTLQPEVADVKERVRKLEAKDVAEDNPTNAAKEAVLRQEKLSDVIVRGIPYTPGAIPAVICKKICSLVGHAPSAYITSMFLKPRSELGDGKPKSAYPILIQFSGAREASIFLTLAKKARKDGILKLSNLDLGFDMSNDCSFFVHENVTPFVNSLLISALKMKRGNKIKSAFTVKGVLHVKTLTDRMVAVYNADKLEAASGIKDGDQD